MFKLNFIFLKKIFYQYNIFSSAGYSYPTAASAYAQYGQTATQQQQQQTAANAYGQQQLDYSTGINIFIIYSFIIF